MRRRLRVFGLALLLVVGGCVSVPTSGPVQPIEGQPPQCTNCVNVDVVGPSPGEDPKAVVEGFLRATSNFQPNYSVARQFLTRAATDTWSPEEGTSIYSGAPQASGTTVVLSGRLLGSLGPDRSYTPQDSPLRVNFGLVTEAGEWRINTPPKGLMVAEFAFDSFYQPYNLYFVGNGRSLVPDPIYLPNLRNPAGTASVLIRSLLDGPSRWLKPAVSSAIPSDTALSVDAVTLSDGIADVPLSAPVLGLNDTQRTLMAAQVVYTLKPIGIQGVRFTVNGQPVPTPGSDPDTFVVSAESTFGDLDPMPFVASEHLYAMRSRGLEQVNGESSVPDAKPMAGPLGTGKYRVESLAVSLNDTELAVVTDGGTTLRRARVAGGAPVTLLQHVSGLLRPQFTRYGDIWAVGNSGGRQRLWVISGNRRTEVNLAGLAGGRITAFKVSPDGSRLAALRRVGNRTELGLARIVRSGRVVVDGWHPLRLNRSNTPSITVLRDIAWADATDLVVLGGSSVDMPLVPYRVTQDAFKITAEGETNNWDAVSLTVSLRSQTSILVSRNGQSWRDVGSQWTPYLDKVRAIAYPD